MRSSNVALAAKMRESRPVVELSGFRTCLLAGGDRKDTTTLKLVQSNEHPCLDYRIIRAHLGAHVLRQEVCDE